jgi:hypothetical protein
MQRRKVETFDLLWGWNLTQCTASSSYHRSLYDADAADDDDDYARNIAH